MTPFHLLPDLPLAAIPAWDPAWTALFRRRREPRFERQDRQALEQARSAVAACLRRPGRPAPQPSEAPAQPNRRMHALVRLLAAGALAAGSLGDVASRAHAAPDTTITVTNLNDGGAGSLRRALRNARTAPKPVLVTFQSGLSGQITLTTGPLHIYDSVTVQGPGADQLTISGNHASRVFYMFPYETMDVTLSGIKIANGSADYGAGVYSQYTNLTLDHVIITGNTDASADGLGGGGLSQRNGSLTIKDSQISGNTSPDSGGGVYFYADTNTPGSVLIQNSQISGNTGAKGGGVYAAYPSSVTVEQSTITGNTATGTLAGYGGGGLYLRSPQAATLRQSTISGNTAAARGGGVYMYTPPGARGSLLIQNTLIDGNTASQGGGLFGISLGSVTVEQSTISGNTAGDRGAGLSLCDPLTAVLQQSTVSGNAAAQDGGGLLVYGYPGGGPAVTIENSTISANQAQAGDGGGIHASQAALQLNNATLAANTAAEAGGGAFLDIATATVKNSIVGDNDAASGKDLAQADLLDSAFSLSYSLVETPPAQWTDQGGNLTSQDPQLGALQDNGGPTRTQLPGGLAIDAGDPAFAPPPAVDQRGYTRVIRGRVDMGAVEANSGVLAFSVADLSAAESAGPVTITVERSGVTEGAVSVSYAAQDGTAVASEDFLPTSGTLSWASGEGGPKTFQVTLVDDARFEPDEVLTLALQDPQGGAALGQYSTLTLSITNDDAARHGVLSFSAARVSAAEGAGPVTITVERSGGSDGAVSVSYAAQPGSASAPADYLPVSGVLSWADGEAGPKTFQVTIVASAAFEPAEAFTLALSSPQGGAALGATSTLTLVISPDAPYVLQLPLLLR